MSQLGNENSGWSSVTVGREVKHVSTKSIVFRQSFLIHFCSKLQISMFYIETREWRSKLDYY